MLQSKGICIEQCTIFQFVHGAYFTLLQIFRLNSIQESLLKFETAANMQILAKNMAPSENCTVPLKCYQQTQSKALLDFSSEELHSPTQAICGPPNLMQLRTTTQDVSSARETFTSQPA